MNLQEYIKNMPNLYKHVLDTVHVPKAHPMYDKYVNDSVWKYMYGDSKVAELSTYIDLQGLKVLDIGAGIGGIAAAFAKKGASVTAIDVDDGYQNLSKIGYDECGVNVDSKLFDGADLPFDDGVYDVVCCFNIFEHVPDVPRLFREMERVLKPGGIVVGRADYRYQKANIKADPHYGIPGIILMPKWFRRWVVVDVLKRNHELDDILWAKNFNDIKKRFSKVDMHTYSWNDDFISIKGPDRNFNAGTGIIDIERQRECFPIGWYRSEEWEDNIVMWSKSKAVIKIIPLSDVEGISFELYSLEDKNININDVKHILKAGIWTEFSTGVNVYINTTTTRVGNDKRNLGVVIRNIKLTAK